MKLIKTILFGVFLLITTQTYSQEVVTYDFNSKNGFDKTIPFDKLITFKLINIPGNPRSVKFVCRKIKNTRDTIRKEYFSKTIWSNQIAKDSTASFVSPKYFLPTKDYEFEVFVFHDSVPVPKAAKDKIKKKLKADGTINKIFQNGSKKLIEGEFENAGQIAKTNFDLLSDEIIKVSKKTLGTPAEFPSNSEVKIEQINFISEYYAGVLVLNDAIINYQNNKDVKSLKVFKQQLKSSNDLIAELKKIQIYPSDLEQLELIEDSIITKLTVEKVDKSDAAYAALAEKEIKKIEQKLRKIKSAWKDLKKMIIEKEEKFTDDFLADVIIQELYYFNFQSQSYPSGLTEQSKNYIALDIGAHYVPNLDQFFLTGQFSVYFRPTRRDIPLSHYNGSWGDFFGSRTSLDLGFTINTINQGDRVSGLGIISNKGGMIGVGFRVLSFAKIGCGAMIYEVSDLNPLITSSNLQASFYFGASIDLSLKGLFSENFSSK